MITLQSYYFFKNYIRFPKEKRSCLIFSLIRNNMMVTIKQVINSDLYCRKSIFLLKFASNDIYALWYTIR